MKAFRKKTKGNKTFRPVTKDSKKFSSKVNAEQLKFSSLNNQSGSVPVIRKQVDPEISKYFTEISNVLDNDKLELDERKIICANALEEARGKELELATDYILSHTLETLLEGCDFEHLCSFVRGCANVFPLLAIDRSGSHVAESVLKSLGRQIEDDDAFQIIENTLGTICKAIITNPIEMMCNSYGSHVLRSLLCFFGGIPIDSPEVHGAKRLSSLTEKHAYHVDQNGSRIIKHRFPELLRLLVWGMLDVSKKNLKILQVDPYGSLVLQTALKLLEGHDDELLKIIPILFGCRNELSEGYFCEISVSRVMSLLKQTAFSHLVEVILEVIPEALYEEMLIKVMKSVMLELSLDQCGNFVVQKLISRACNEKQFGLIWDELRANFGDIFEAGKPSIIASLAATSQRLDAKQYEFAESLATAFCASNEEAKNVVPRILCLDSYFSSNDRPSWTWPKMAKLHATGSAILQAVFRFQSDTIQNYISSILSLETEQIIEVAKDSRGARVIEAFLDGNVSMKMKRKFITRLRGRFGELAMQPSSSFTVEKCFSLGNLSLREIIASDVLEVKGDLTKTKQGPYLLRNMDIDSFENRREQWRLKQEAKQSTYREFVAAFGSKESQSSNSDSFVHNDKKKKSQLNDLKIMQDEIEQDLTPHKRSNQDKPLATSKATESKERKPFLSSDLKKRPTEDASLKHSRKIRKS